MTELVSNDSASSYSFLESTVISTLYDDIHSYKNIQHHRSCSIIIYLLSKV